MGHHVGTRSVSHEDLEKERKRFISFVLDGLLN